MPPVAVPHRTAPVIPAAPRSARRARRAPGEPLRRLGGPAPARAGHGELRALLANALKDPNPGTAEHLAAVDRRLPRGVGAAAGGRPATVVSDPSPRVASPERWRRRARRTPCWRKRGARRAGRGDRRGNPAAAGLWGRRSSPPSGPPRPARTRMRSSGAYARPAPGCGSGSASTPSSTCAAAGGSARPRPGSAARCASSRSSPWSSRSRRSERVRTAARAFERMVRYAEELRDAGSDGLGSCSTSRRPSRHSA